MDFKDSPQIVSMERKVFVMGEHLTLPMSSENFSWLIQQLEQWPTRVDPEKTTNIQFLMKSAAVVIRHLSADDIDSLIVKSSDPVTDAKTKLISLNAHFQRLVRNAKEISKSSSHSDSAWEHVYERTQHSNVGGRVKELVEITGGVFDYYDPGTSRRDDAMAFISALRSYVEKM